MRFLFLVTLFVISFQAEKTNAIEIQCQFYEVDWGYGLQNGCEVESVTLSSCEDREITNVNGDDEKTYDDVWWFKSDPNDFNNFPKNIKKIFPYVKDVYINTANISTLTKSDMASVGSQLRTFFFDSNKIEVLEEGLFDENPNLEVIFLRFNKIKFVASGVFDKLPNLTSLAFDSNPCHSGYADDDRAKVLTLIPQIKGSCQDNQAYEKFRNLFPTTEKVKTEHELRIEELTVEVEELKQQQLADGKQHQEELHKHDAEASLKDAQNAAKNKEFEEQIDALKKELAAMTPCNEVRDSLMRKFKEFKEEFDTTKDMMKATDAKLDSTLVEPMSSLHAKLDKMNLKLDSTDEKFESLNATCVGLDYKLNVFECIRQP